MSHFSLGVISANTDNLTIDSLMERYSENRKVDFYIYKTKEDIIKEMKENQEYLRKNNYTENRLLKCTTDEELFNYYKKSYGSKFDNNGNELTTHNPESRWDWYTIGGRGNILINKKGEYCYTSKIKNIDFEKMNKELEEENLEYATKKWEVVVEGKEDVNNEFEFFSKDYMLEEFKTKDVYIKYLTLFLTHALLTPDGEWHEQGKAGYFATISNFNPSKWIDTFYKLIDEYKNYYLTIVDCHI